MLEEAKVIEGFRPKFDEDEIPGSFASALSFMRSEAFLDSSRYRALVWNANRFHADPSLVAFEQGFIRRFEKLGVPMYAEELYRSDATQNRLYVTGKADAGAGSSPHNFGKAITLVHARRGRELPRLCWELIAHVGKEVISQKGLSSIVWDGDRPGGDPALWYVDGWRDDLPSPDPSADSPA